MKVVQVTPRYAPRTGGVETQVQELSERLVNRGHDVSVITADADRSIPSLETRNGVSVRRYTGIAPGGAFHIAPGVLRAVRTDADVVHAHNIHSLPLPFATVASSARVVATPYYHGASASGWRNVLWRGYRPIAGLALRRAAAVTAVSDWERSMLADDFGVDADVIPIGLNVAKFHNAEPVERDRPYLFCVTRLETYKGVQHVIEALSEISEYDLVVAGDGPYRGELESLTRDLDLAGRVEFLGNVDHDDLPSYYAGAEVYISLSEFESYGITVAEALASGTPCVIRKGSALDEWTGQRGCTGVTDVTPDTVRAAVNRVRNSPPSRSVVPEWDCVVDKFLSVYTDGADQLETN